MPSVHEFTAPATDGTHQPLTEYRGKVLLIVNTASKCGLSSQYHVLEMLWRKYRDRGLVVLGFPCNQFADQEPGSDAEISAFCELNYGVSFPLFAKTNVNGPQALPLFNHLKKSAPGLLGSGAVKWNFTKFLVDRDGSVVARYAPVTKPEKIEQAIERLLG